MMRETLINILCRHHISIIDFEGIVCECGYVFPDNACHEDPRTAWARHVANAIYPES